MADIYTLAASTRNDLGKGASRRLRRNEGRIPGILYGADAAPTSIAVSVKELSKALENEAFYSHVLTIELDGTPVKAVLKDLQRHPAKNVPTHADFQRVDETHKIQMHVPVHFINEDKCVGVKAQGGIISHQVVEVVVSCLAKDLPEYLEVDMANVTLGQTIHLSDLALPAGVTLVELTHGPEHDLPVVNVHAPRGGAEEAPAAE